MSVRPPEDLSARSATGLGRDRRCLALASRGGPGAPADAHRPPCSGTLPLKIKAAPGMGSAARRRSTALRPTPIGRLLPEGRAPSPLRPAGLRPGADRLAPAPPPTSCGGPFAPQEEPALSSPPADRAFDLRVAGRQGSTAMPSRGSARTSLPTTRPPSRSAPGPTRRIEEELWPRRAPCCPSSRRRCLQMRTACRELRSPARSRARGIREPSPRRRARSSKPRDRRRPRRRSSTAVLGPSTGWPRRSATCCQPRVSQRPPSRIPTEREARAGQAPARPPCALPSEPRGQPGWSDQPSPTTAPRRFAGPLRDEAERRGSLVRRPPRRAGYSDGRTASATRRPRFGLAPVKTADRVDRRLAGRIETEPGRGNPRVEPAAAGSRLRPSLHVLIVERGGQRFRPLPARERGLEAVVPSARR